LDHQVKLEDLAFLDIQDLLEASMMESFLQMMSF